MMTPDTPSGFASTIETTRFTSIAVVAYAVTARTRPMPTSIVSAIVAEHVTS